MATETAGDSSNPVRWLLREYASPYTGRLSIGLGVTAAGRFAQRLSTVRDADRIIVLDEGRVVEAGTHEELLDAEGLYATLWRVQVGNVDALPPEFLERVERRADTFESK